MTHQTFSAELNHLAAALAKAQASIEGAKEDSVNPFFKSKYADLSSVWNACKVPLSSNGLSVLQTVENGGDKAYLVTTLLHSSGQWVRSFMPIMMTKQDPQAFGSAITYSRRYALAAMVGVCPADDDAEQAMQSARVPTSSTNYISDNQLEELERLLKGKEELRTRVLEWANIQNLADLPASKYYGALKGINLDMAKKGVA